MSNITFENITSCPSSSMSGSAIAATTFISLLIYGFAFFIMSTAVGQDPTVSSLASWKHNCSHFCGFMKNTIGGIFFCCDQRQTATAEFEIPRRRRTAINSGESSGGRLAGSVKQSGNSRRGFQLLSSASREDTSASDAYAENNQPSTE
jgi:hypothetical protein